MDDIEVVHEFDAIEQTDFLESTKIKNMDHHSSQPLVYSVNEKPPICLTLMLAIQLLLAGLVVRTKSLAVGDLDLLSAIYLLFILMLVAIMTNTVTTIAGALVVINILAPKLCILPEDPAQAYLLSTTIMMAGISTLFQTVLGVRLPIIQNSGFAYMICSVSIMNSSNWQCQNEVELYSMGSEARTLQWQIRIRDLQGSIIVISIIQMLLGYSGFVGRSMKYIGPLTIVPTMCIVALTIIERGVHLMSGNWTTSLVTLFFLTLFSQYFREITISIPVLSTVKGLVFTKLKIFSLFSVLFSVGIMWIACAYMTFNNELLPTDPANTESKSGVFNNAQVFRLPYPFQWGLPTFNIRSIIALLPALFTSIVESIGSYYTCARFANLTLPPLHAINRGIGIQGISSILAGLLGTGTGISASSENVCNNGITQVCSRIVIQYAAVILIFIAPFTKLVALLITLPDPVLGALMTVLLAMVAAVGLSNLQFINLNSMRNLYILSMSLFFGLAVPKYVSIHENQINTKIEILNQTLNVFMSSGMFIGGLVAFIMDNTIPDDSQNKIKTSIFYINEDEAKINNGYDIEDEKTYKISERLFDRIQSFLTFFV